MSWHHSVSIANISPSAISMSATDHSGQIFLGVLVLLILALIGGLARE